MRMLLAGLAAALSALTAYAQDDDGETRLITDEAVAGAAEAAAYPPLVREAGRLALYFDDAEALANDEMTALEELDAALNTIASYAPADLSRSWVAYAALVAGQSPEFIDGARSTADYYGSRRLRRGLTDHPGYAASMPGAAEARARVIEYVRNASIEVFTAGEAVRMAAYTLQSNQWARARVTDNDARINALRAASLRPRFAPGATYASISAPGFPTEREFSRRSSEIEIFNGVFDLNIDYATSARLDLATNPNINGPDFADRAISLAALAAIGGAEDDNVESVNTLLYEPDADQCMAMARAHFHQCIAAAHFRYEDPFCIAQHGLSDVAQCLNIATSDNPVSAVSAEPTE